MAVLVNPWCCPMDRLSLINIHRRESSCRRSLTSAMWQRKPAERPTRIEFFDSIRQLLKQVCFSTAHNSVSPLGTEENSTISVDQATASSASSKGRNSEMYRT